MYIFIHNINFELSRSFLHTSFGELYKAFWKLLPEKLTNLALVILALLKFVYLKAEFVKAPMKLLQHSFVLC